MEKGSSKRADRALAAFAAAISSPENRRLFENNEVSLDKINTFPALFGPFRNGAGTS